MEPRQSAEISGALSSFWAGGDGASHASISTAFALAGHVEPQENESLNKEQRVLRALRSTTGEPFMRLVEELVALIRGMLEDDGSPQKARTLRAAFQRANSSLSPEGFVVWDSGLTRSIESVAASSQPMSPPANPLDLKIRNMRGIVDQLEVCSAPRDFARLIKEAEAEVERSFGAGSAESVDFAERFESLTFPDLSLAESWDVHDFETALGELLGHLSNLAFRLEEQGQGPVPQGEGHQRGRVFIGHGNAPLWRELALFLREDLQILYDEFNRVSVAGRTTVERLREMMDSADVALLVLTAEDEQADGLRVARLNVVHEVGLFQGRLGFERAIVLLVDGCEEFSNIEGLSQIRFPAGNIGAAFHDVRKVLRREGVAT